MKRIAIFILVVAGLQACNKETSAPINEPAAADSFDELVVPDNFNWSSSTSGAITVNLQNNGTVPAALSHTELWLRDGDSRKVAAAEVRNGEASFYVTAPAEVEGLHYYFPATGESWPLTQLGAVNLPLENPLDTTSLPANSIKGKTNFVAFPPPGTNMLGNADFEQDDFTKDLGYNFDPTTGTIDAGKWLVTDNDVIWATESGSKVLKVKNARWTHFWQLHNVNAGDSIFFTAGDFSGEVYVYLFFYESPTNKSYLSYRRVPLGTNPEGIEMVVPNGAKVVSALVNMRSNAWVDNMFLSNPPAVTDSDNDGIADELDDFPNDASRASRSFLPVVGRQTVAFEDLWPSKGDYDFNDMIVNTKMTLVKNASNELVEAKVKVSLDAVGAGLASGLALRLVDISKQPFNSDFMASVSGDASLDPAVKNGVIVFNKPSELRSQFYDNTRPEFMATPDTAEFTITFKAGTNNTFLTDFYIFRDGERGREVHLPGFAGTAAADVTLNDTEDDLNGSYKTSTGLPWAMELILDGTNFEHPREKVDMIQAYPQFSRWAASGGESNLTWYLNPALGETIDLNN